MARHPLSGSGSLPRESLPLPGKAAPAAPDPMSRGGGGGAAGGPTGTSFTAHRSEDRVWTAGGRAAGHTADSLSSFLPSSPAP